MDSGHKPTFSKSEIFVPFHLSADTFITCVMVESHLNCGHPWLALTAAATSELPSLKIVRSASVKVHMTHFGFLIICLNNLYAFL